MPSPFPGMDPYLESSRIWPEFHGNLAGEIQAQINPKLIPNYVAALEVRITYETITIQRSQPRTAIPDISVWQRMDWPHEGGVAVAIPPAPVIGEVVETEEVPVKQYSVEIRKVDTDELVTAIEILSPTNKREGHDAYYALAQKRRELRHAGVNLMEIDLLRAGKRPTASPPLPNEPYFIFLYRADQRGKVAMWPLALQASIPLLPIPLKAPDPDVPLDLGQAIQSVYTRAAYAIRIDYTQPPPQPDLFKDEDKVWTTETLHIPVS